MPRDNSTGFNSASSMGSGPRPYTSFPQQLVISLIISGDHWQRPGWVRRVTVGASETRCDHTVSWASKFIEALALRMTIRQIRLLPVHPPFEPRLPAPEPEADSNLPLDSLERRGMISAYSGITLLSRLLIFTCPPLPPGTWSLNPDELRRWCSGA